MRMSFAEMQVQRRGDQGRKAGGDSDVAAEVDVDVVILTECRIREKVRYRKVFVR